MITNAQKKLWAKQDVLEWQLIMHDLSKSFGDNPPQDLLEAWEEIDRGYQKRLEVLSMTQQDIDLTKIKDAENLMGQNWNSLSPEDQDKWLSRYETLCSEYLQRYGESEFQTRKRMGEISTALISQSPPESSEDLPQQSALF